MPNEFAVVPYIANPVQGDIAGWIRRGSKNPYTDCYLACTVNQLFKIAYYKRNSGAYQSLIMTKATTTISVSYQLTSNGIDWTLSSTGLSERYGDDARYSDVIATGPSTPVNLDIPVYEPDPQNPTDYEGAKQAAIEALYYSSWDEPTPPVTQYPITYRLTNATAPDAPTEAEIGDTVTVELEFPEGYGIVNPQTDIYVTCNGVTVQSSYSAGRLVFTMPDPT